MIEARRENDAFQEWKLTDPKETWKEYQLGRWRELIEFYLSLNWKLIPIGVRAKSPLRAQYNYESRGALGPYCDREQALYWVSKSFNLAVVAGPSKIVWCDMDTPELFRKEFLSGLVFRSPRGYGMPLRPDRSITEAHTEKLKNLGYDFRTDILYSLVPNSSTCRKDHHLGKVKHPGPQHPCVDSKPHDYRLREFITPLSNKILSFKEFMEVAL